MVLLKIVAKRLGDYCEAKGLLPEEQCEFRPRRSTLDMMFALQRLQELGREARVPLCLYFIDLLKACDSVDRSLLWQILDRFGVPRQYRDGMKACAKNDNGEFSEEFNVEQGLRQGCVLSPLC